MDVYKHQIGSITVCGSGAPCRHIPQNEQTLEHASCFTEAMNAYMEYNISFILILLSYKELREDYADMKTLFASYKRNGYVYDHYAIRDFCVPDSMETFHELIQRLAEICRKENVLIHCGAGGGRTGLVLAALHIYFGESSQDALDKVRKVRPHSVDTQEQEKFLFEYAKHYKGEGNPIRETL